MAKQNNESNPPERNFRLGNVNAAVWCNETSGGNSTGTFRTVQLDQRYQDSISGEWKTSNRFSLDQLLRLRVCINKAIEHIASKEFEG